VHRCWPPQSLSVLLLDVWRNKKRFPLAPCGLFPPFAGLPAVCAPRTRQPTPPIFFHPPSCASRSASSFPRSHLHTNHPLTSIHQRCRHPHSVPEQTHHRAQTAIAAAFSVWQRHRHRQALSEKTLRNTLGIAAFTSLHRPPRRTGHDILSSLSQTAHLGDTLHPKHPESPRTYSLSVPQTRRHSRPKVKNDLRPRHLHRVTKPPPYCTVIRETAFEPATPPTKPSSGKDACELIITSPSVPCATVLLHDRRTVDQASLDTWVPVLVGAESAKRWAADKTPSAERLD